MSLHLTYNVKEPTKTTPSQSLFLEGDPGAWISVTVEANRVVRRCGDVPLGGVFRTVKHFFAFFFQGRANPQKSWIYGM